MNKSIYVYSIDKPYGIYYHKLKKVIKLPERRNLSLKTDRYSSGVPVEMGEILFVWASDGRSSFHAYVFLKEVQRYCKNKPEMVDRGSSMGFEKAWFEV